MYISDINSQINAINTKENVYPGKWPQHTMGNEIN